MGVYGSGTYADPWTYVDLSAYDFCGMVTDGGTYYAKVGTYFNVTDSGDPHDEVDFFVSYVNPNTYGIYISNWNLVGTCSTAGTVTIEIMESWPEYGEEFPTTITLVILPPPSYTVSVYSAGGGTVSGGGTYTQGSTATISATPNTGYHFTNWSDGNTSASRSFTVTGNVSLTAYFAINTYTVSFGVNTSGYGSVSPASIANVPYGSSISVSGSTVTINGTTVTATASSSTAQYSYAFSSWSNASGTVTANRTITANFTRTLRSYTITIASNNTDYGTVSPTSITASYGASISASGNVVTVGSSTSTATAKTATAQYTYAFSSWTNASGTVSGTKTITANFTRTTNSYTITTAVDPTGTGSVTGGGSYNYGSSATLTATPSTGYEFSQWSDGNTSNPRTVTVTGTATYTAQFVVGVAYVKVNVNGSWVNGAVKAKVNGSWVNVKKVYVKVNGTWEES